MDVPRWSPNPSPPRQAAPNDNGSRRPEVDVQAAIPSKVPISSSSVRSEDGSYFPFSAGAGSFGPNDRDTRRRESDAEHAISGKVPISSSSLRSGGGSSRFPFSAGAGSFGPSEPNSRQPPNAMDVATPSKVPQISSSSVRSGNGSSRFPFSIGAGSFRPNEHNSHRPPDGVEVVIASNAPVSSPTKPIVDRSTHVPFSGAAAGYFQPETHGISVDVGGGGHGKLASASRRSSALGEDEAGASLTWEDLWVVAPDRNGGKKAILKGLTGYARPGEVLAIMGPSGCGKSTLLDTLAGRLASDVRQSGRVLVNGRRQRLSFGTSSYVTQDDILMTTLTVREAVTYSALLQLPPSMTTSEKAARAEETIREMGLEDAADTRIGGWAVKGLSGGQKRRVSICIEILTRPKLLFLDEPTSGLDSAAAYHVVGRIVRLARRDGMTVIASIHQPGSEVFGLFGNLCLLAYGKTVYFGEPPTASEFFTKNGFPCPALTNPSDHYLRTVNKDFDKVIEEDNESKGTMTVAQAIEVLTKSYQSSDAHAQVKSTIARICKQEGEMVKRRDQANFMTQSVILTRRSFVNMYRDLGYYWLRFGIYMMLCLCLGTIFYNIGHTFGSIQARGAVLFFTAAFLTFMAIGGFPSFVEDMKIFGRERLNGHYGVSSFVIANTVSSAPYLALISVIPGAMAYYLIHLQKSFDHFIYFALVLFTCMMLVESLMMIVAAAVPDFLMGIITGAGIQGVMMLNGGFFRLPRDLPNPVWKYPMYYISFHRYANQGFFKNEFLGLTFPNQRAGGPPTIGGTEILTDMWQVNMSYSKWVDLVVLLSMVVLYRFLFLAIIKGTEKLKPMIRRMMDRGSNNKGAFLLVDEQPQASPTN